MDPGESSQGAFTAEDAETGLFDQLGLGGSNPSPQVDYGLWLLYFE
jgi:hypothetical protein